MTHKDIPYDMTNYFLSSSKTKFFLYLIDLEKKKRSMYDIRNECKISYIHSRMILKSLKHYKLLSEYEYDSVKGSYIIKFSKSGLELRKKILEIKELLEKIGVWEDDSTAKD